MKRNPMLAGILSLIIPGMGQIYCGERKKGATILFAAIVIGNLSILFILFFLWTDPDQDILWAYWIPRIGHDVLSFWSLAFWVWAVCDAYILAKKTKHDRKVTELS